MFDSEEYLRGFESVSASDLRSQRTYVRDFYSEAGRILNSSEYLTPFADESVSWKSEGLSVLLPIHAYGKIDRNTHKLLEYKRCCNLGIIRFTPYFELCPFIHLAGDEGVIINCSACNVNPYPSLTCQTYLRTAFMDMADYLPGSTVLEGQEVRGTAAYGATVNMSYAMGKASAVMKMFMVKVYNTSREAL